MTPALPDFIIEEHNCFVWFKYRWVEIKHFGELLNNLAGIEINVNDNKAMKL